MPTFGEKLQKLRREQGLTMLELAELLGSDERRIENLETNTKKPFQQEFRDICGLFNVVETYFFEDGVPQLAYDKFYDSRKGVPKHRAKTNITYKPSIGRDSTPPPMVDGAIYDVEDEIKEAGKKMSTDEKYPKRYAFGQKLREARIDAGLSQRDIGKAVDRDHNAGYTWEKGLAFPSEEEFLKVCGALGLNRGYFEPEYSAAVAENIALGRVTQGVSYGKGKDMTKVVEAKWEKRIREAKTPLSRAIITYRRDNNLTQIDFAKKVGLSRDTIKDYEGGRYVPSPVTVAAISEVIGIPVDILIPSDEAKDPTPPPSEPTEVQEEITIGLDPQVEEELQEEIEETPAPVITPSLATDYTGFATTSTPTTPTTYRIPNTIPYIPYTPEPLTYAPPQVPVPEPEPVAKPVDRKIRKATVKIPFGEKEIIIEISEE